MISFIKSAVFWFKLPKANNISAAPVEATDIASIAESMISIN